MIGLVVGQAKLQQRQLVIDGVGQAEPIDQFVSQRQTAVRDDLATFLDNPR